MGAAVPFAGATMTGFGGAAATTAATSALTMGASSFVPALLTQSTGIPMSGGLLGSTGFLSSLGPMDAVFGLTQGLSFMQGIRQGDIMKNQYKIQELQTLAQMETDRFNAIKTSMDRFDRLKRIQAANISKSYAGGVSGLDGSALLNQIVSDQEYGKDYKIDLMSIDRIATMGQVNADIYRSSASRAPDDAMLDAGVKLATSAYSYSKLG
jgi:hypothetical protein